MSQPEKPLSTILPRNTPANFCASIKQKKTSSLSLLERTDIKENESIVPFIIKNEKNTSYLIQRTGLKELKSTTFIPPEIPNSTEILQLEQILEQTALPKNTPNYTEKDFERALTYGKPEPTRQEQTNVQYGKEKPAEEQPNLYKKQTEDDEKGTNASETMTHQEANGKLQDIQYAQVTGNMQLLDLQERRRFANWAQYNPELLSLFHNIHSITGDVDYSRTF